MFARFRWRARGGAAAGLLIAVVLALAPLTVRAGHDQGEDDLVYFMPNAPERARLVG